MFPSSQEKPNIKGEQDKMNFTLSELYEKIDCYLDRKICPNFSPSFFFHLFTLPQRILRHVSHFVGLYDF